MKCASCCWSTHDKQLDVDGDTTYKWRCWRDSGEPRIRAIYNDADREPPGCSDHYCERA